MTYNSKYEFRYELFNFKNLSELSDIYGACFGQGNGEQYFQWKYLDNPSGIATAFVAREGNRIAAFYGIIPELYQVGEHKFVIFQSMDTMTHPDYQRLGLFTALAKRLYDHLEAEEAGLSIIGFPGPSSHGGFVKKLDWTTISEQKLFFLTRNLFNLRSFTRNYLAYEAKHVTHFGLEFDNLCSNLVLPTNRICKVVSRETANWRFVDKPGSKIKLVNILKLGELVSSLAYDVDHEKNRAFIHFWKVARECDASQAIASGARCIFESEGVNSISTFLSDGNLDRFLTRSGFLQNPFDFGPFHYRTPIIVYGKRPVHGLNIHEKENWILEPFQRDY